VTPEEGLSARLQDDKTWRIRELSELVRACQDASSIRREALLRASVPLLYAHWEGYFVLAANNYLTFVTEKRLQISDLKDEFWALTVRKRYRPNQIASERTFSRFLLDIRKDTIETFKKGKYDRINGQSNLNSEVLSFCCSTLGLSASPFETYLDFIDKNLIDKRNFVAHGSSLRFDVEGVSEYRDKVVDLLRIVQTEIENASISGAFRR